MSSEHVDEEGTLIRWASLCAVTLFVVLLSGAALQLEELVGWLSDAPLTTSARNAPARNTAARDQSIADAVLHELPAARDAAAEEQSASTSPGLSSSVDRDSSDAVPAASREAGVDFAPPSGHEAAKKADVSGAEPVILLSVRSDIEDTVPAASDGSVALPPAEAGGDQYPRTMSTARIAPAEAPVQSSASHASLSAQEERLLLQRGADLLAQSDIASARLYFERAAETGSGRGALELARSFDPIALEARGSMMRGDPEQAATWYLKAIEFGRPDARPLLDALLSRRSQR